MLNKKQIKNEEKKMRDVFQEENENTKNTYVVLPA